MTNRFALAAKVLLGRSSSRRPVAQKAVPYIFPTWRNGQAHWALADFRAYVEDGFSINSIIYSAIMYKAKTIAQARLLAYTGDPDQPTKLPIIHPLQALLKRPNPQQGWMEFQMQREVYLMLSGNSYTYLDRQQRDGLPVALYNLRPDRVWLTFEEKQLRGFVYVPENQPQDRMPFLPRDVEHVKLPNPLDPYEGQGYGMSPVAPMAQSGDVDNAVTHFLKMFFEHGAMPAGILKTNVPLDDTEINRIRERWHDVYGGFDNWMDVAVLDMNSEYQRLGLTFAEMEFDGLDARNESRMIAPFGVPPQLLFTRYGQASSL